MPFLPDSDNRAVAPTIPDAELRYWERLVDAEGRTTGWAVTPWSPPTGPSGISDWTVWVESGEFTGWSGWVESAPWIVTPTVTVEPGDLTVVEPSPAVLTARIQSADTFRWVTLDATDTVVAVPGATTETLTINPTSAASHSGKVYQLEGWHSSDPATVARTRWATLTVTAQQVPDLVDGNINKIALGAVTQASLEAAFGSLFWTNALGRLEVVADANGDRYLRQRYPAGVVGGGAAFAKRLPAGIEEVWHSYQVWFETGWQWVKGGKLGPGVGGGTYPSGGTYTAHGFTARDMWRDKSGKHAQVPRLEQYLYYEEMTQTYGEEVNLGAPAAYPPVGEWVTITHRVKLNSGLNADGVVDTWINGVQCNSWTGRLRKSGSFTIDQYRHHSFYGGSTSDWAPTVDTYARFRRYKCARTSAGVDLAPPSTAPAPAPASGVYVTDPFTGTTGDPWSATIWEAEPANRTDRIDANRGRIVQPASSTAYVQTNRPMKAGFLTADDFTLTFDWYVDSLTKTDVGFMFRDNGGSDRYEVRVRVEDTSFQTRIFKRTSTTAATSKAEATTGVPHAAGVWYREKIMVNGAQIRVKRWRRDTETEPAVALIDWTDDGSQGPVLTGSTHRGFRSTLGTNAGTFTATVFVDNVEVSEATPVRQWYANGTRPALTVSDLRTKARAQYDDFLAYTLKSDGMPTGMPAGAKRIAVPDGNPAQYGWPAIGGTVSEGMGYGLKLCAWFGNPSLPTGVRDPNARANFDALWAYVNHFRNANGLMSWSIRHDGIVADTGAASDGDFDIAMGLITAHRMWGSGGAVNYGAAATAMVNAIRDKDFTAAGYTGVGGGNVMMNGDAWGAATDVFMPDYFRPAYFREFYRHTGDSRWLDIITKNYPIALGYFHTNYTGGVVPDRCKRDSTIVDATKPEQYRATYNSVRMGFGVAADFLWNGAAGVAQDMTKKAAAKAKSLWPTGGAVKAPDYDLDLTGGATFSNNAGWGLFAPCALVDSTHATFAAEIVNAIAADTELSYYNMGVATVASAYMAGIARPQISL